MSRKYYGHRVCVDNWEEDRHLEKAKEEGFLQKEGKGELLFQKIKNVVAQLSRSTILSVSTDGYVHFGDVVKLYHDAAGLQAEMCLATNIPFQVAMSLNPSEGPFNMVATRNGPATKRNSFTIKTTANTHGDKRQLFYGEPFLLTSTLEYKTMFVSSNMASFGKAVGLSGHQELSLVDRPSCYTMWKVQSAQPEYVLEMEGHPVPVNKSIGINHVFTNKDLAFEKYILRSLFGDDHEVSVHTYSNGPRHRDPHNLWRFQTTEPQP